LPLCRSSLSVGSASARTTSGKLSENEAPAFLLHPENRNNSMTNALTAEHRRLDEARAGVPWKMWGPYLSERQWGTVREDYSANGSAWDYFTHDQARSRAYRWGEDGLAGYSDEKQRLCFALALWNGADPILKERLFGLTNSEGNHGEDVKEYYFYLDSTPTHSYMKYLYKYPQRPYPYGDLVRTNRTRSRLELEYELLDTGVFDDDRYFDVFVEYAKSGPEDTNIRITIANRGPEPADLHVLPTLWFRNIWSWDKRAIRPSLQGSRVGETSVVSATHPELGAYRLYCNGEPELLFTENDTNSERVFGVPNASPYVKDGIENYILRGLRAAVNPSQTGTKASAHYRLEVAGGSTVSIDLRLCKAEPKSGGDQADTVIQNRKREADEFYDAVIPPTAPEDDRLIMRQALASMLWTKQYYYFDLDEWLQEPRGPGKLKSMRNSQWFHMINDDIISMPDKWEYPWYAAWDLAFHTVALAIVDLDFAKRQLSLMLDEVYIHPNGQIPAYEWNFGDVNPPVHAWATHYVYMAEKASRGEGDLTFLRDSFRKLLLNFGWWVNRKDRDGKNIFEGGFLGLDNIGVFDRSAPLPTGGYLEQADGTAWMALYCQSMLSIAMELAAREPSHEGLVCKFIEHFFWIAGAMDRVGENQDELWDEKDGFFYDVLRFPDGSATRIKLRSLVGLLPLCAVCVIPPEFIAEHPAVMKRVHRFRERHPEIVANIHPIDKEGVAGRRMLSILTEAKLRPVLARMLDEERFLSPHGIRSISRWHKDHPYVFQVHGEEYTVAYEPAESTSGMFGGNSNWRGPVWFPVNILIIRALLNLYEYFGDQLKVECPTGSGRLMSLFEVAREISSRLVGIFRRDEHGSRPVFGGSKKFRNDPHWCDYLLFYEYFHGDNGAGIGASHQTGWTGLVARLVDLLAELRPESIFRYAEADAFEIGGAEQLGEEEVRRAARHGADD
jgi:hypothetical protein